MKASEARHLSDMLIKANDDAKEAALLKKFDAVFGLIKGALASRSIDLGINNEDIEEFVWLLKRLGYQINYVNSAKTSTTRTLNIRW